VTVAAKGDKEGTGADTSSAVQSDPVSSPPRSTGRQRVELGRRLFNLDEVRKVAYLAWCRANRIDSTPQNMSFDEANRAFIFLGAAVPQEPDDGEAVPAPQEREDRTVIDADAARLQWKALINASQDSPIRQYRYELGRRAVEWRRAADLLDASDDDEAAIELAGSVTPGMKVPTAGNEQQWGSVVRQLTRDGQLTLHVEDALGRPLYLNYVGPSSPVVVKA
jgi:hypothetical protein